MILLLRRILVLLALFFWQGGFVFYASVVIPVGTEVFQQHYRSDNRAPSERRQQGRITRTVASWLNISGVIALLPMGWDAFNSSDPSRQRKRCRKLLWTATAAILALLIWMYFRLDAAFDRGTLALLDESGFLRQHRIYLWLASVQWGACVLYLLLTVAAWRAEDLSTRNENGPMSIR